MTRNGLFQRAKKMFLISLGWSGLIPQYGMLMHDWRCKSFIGLMCIISSGVKLLSMYCVCVAFRVFLSLQRQECL